MIYYAHFRRILKEFIRRGVPLSQCSVKMCKFLNIWKGYERQFKLRMQYSDGKHGPSLTEHASISSKAHIPNNSGISMVTCVKHASYPGSSKINHIIQATQITQIYLDLSRSTEINPDQPKSTQTNPDQPRSNQINTDHPRSTNINPYQPISTQINPDQSRSTHIKTDQPR